MTGEIFQILNATFGISFAVTIAVLALAFWLTHWITKKVTEIRTEHGDLRKLTERNEQHIDEIRQDLSFIKGTIDIFKGNKQNGQNQLMQHQSPIALTEEGKKVAEELKAEEIIDKNWERIRTTMEKVKGKNAYDIQQFCIERASTDPDWFFDTETIDRVKMYAFRKGMPVQLYLRLLGLLIRDRYFKENGIPLYEVDDNEPALD